VNGVPTAAAAELFAYLLVFVRVGAAIAVLPGFSATYVAARVRLTLALVLSLLLAPLLAPALPAMPGSPLALALLITGEAVTGAFLGLIPRIMIAALHAAGTFAAFFASLTSALVQDAMAEQQSSTLAGFFLTAGMVLIFVADLHHLMLRALAESYAVLPPGEPLATAAAAESLARALGQSFRLGLQLSVPFLIASVATNVAMGLLGRLMPQLPVLFFGLPAQLSLNIWVLMLAFSGVMMAFLNPFAVTLSGLAGG
jgi:flagellar biosynthetic protein FliR